MTPLHTIVLLTALTAGGGPATAAPTASSVLGEIEVRYQRGDLSVDQYHLYRVAAIKAPARLPAELRALVGQAPAPGSGTSVLVEAMQHVMRTGDWGGDIHNLLQPPPDLSYTLESTVWPIRVSYGAVGQAGYAQNILDAAELSWEVQINDFGFYQPVMESGFEPYRFYVQDAGQGYAGYTSPYDNDPTTTSHDACFTYIVIDPDLGGSVGSTVAHEVNHSMQLTMDCLEQRTFMENTAVFVEGLTHPDFFAETLWFIPSFQAEPYRGLDYFETGSGYQYGGVLWLHYLADELAVPDAGVFARELWEECMQTSAGVGNEPDYFDAVEAVAASYGGALSDMESLYAEFAEARYFVGSADDGQHITDAYVFNATPNVTVTHSVEDLPVLEQQPPSTQRPAPFGTNFVRVDVTPGWDHPVTLRFDGEESTRWEVRVVLVGDGMETVSETMTLDATTWVGTVTVAPAGYERMLMVVANLGTEDFDPDLASHPVAGYHYNIEGVLNPAVVTDIVPAAVTRGQQNLHLRIRGENFVYGPEFQIVFSDPMLQVGSIDGFSSSQVMFTLTVPAGAQLGSYDVTVINGGGQEAFGVGMITVVDDMDSLDPGPGPQGCQTGAAPGPASLLVGLLLFTLVGLRRRRR